MGVRRRIKRPSGFVVALLPGYAMAMAIAAGAVAIILVLLNSIFHLWSASGPPQ